MATKMKSAKWPGGPGGAYTYAVGEEFAVPDLATAQLLRANGWATFSSSDDETANAAAVAMLRPNTLIGVDTYLQPNADGTTDPTVVIRPKA